MTDDENKDSEANDASEICLFLHLFLKLFFIFDSTVGMLWKNICGISLRLKGKKCSAMNALFVLGEFFNVELIPNVVFVVEG